MLKHYNGTNIYHTNIEIDSFWGPFTLWSASALAATPLGDNYKVIKKLHVMKFNSNQTLAFITLDLVKYFSVKSIESAQTRPLIMD